MGSQWMLLSVHARHGGSCPEAIEQKVPPVTRSMNGRQEKNFSLKVLRPGSWWRVIGQSDLQPYGLWWPIEGGIYFLPIKAKGSLLLREDTKDSVSRCHGFGATRLALSSNCTNIQHGGLLSQHESALTLECGYMQLDTVQISICSAKPKWNCQPHLYNVNLVKPCSFACLPAALQVLRVTFELLALLARERHKGLDRKWKSGMSPSWMPR